jgi:hypothetical protein
MYLLADHVHVCGTSEAMVLLDLRQDRYLGLDQQQVHALATFVEGWPIAEQPENVDRATAVQLVDEMLQQGLLTSDATHGKRATRVRLPDPTSQLVTWDRQRWPKIRTHHLVNFSQAVIQAAAWLRASTLEETVVRLQRRKQRNHATSAASTDSVRNLSTVFWALRPFFYTWKDQCLFDSLVLANFLSRYRLYPWWIIGVRAAPFAAHSWIQCENFVVNGTPEYVDSFTPILAV